MGIGSAIGGIASVGASLLGGSSQSSAASSAGMYQAMAAMQAAQLQQQMFQQQQANIQPYIQAGQSALSALSPLIGTNSGGNPLTAPLTSKFAPTMDQLAQTPGYQFNLDQGLSAVQNSAAAKGLATSGPALASAAQYASGLASTTYQQQFQNYWNQNQSIYNMLTGQGQLGVGAATNNNSVSAQVGNNIAGNLIGAGNALGASTVGASNAMWNGVNNALAYGHNGLQTGAFNGLGTAISNGWNSLTCGSGGGYDPLVGYSGAGDLGGYV